MLTNSKNKQTKGKKMTKKIQCPNHEGNFDCSPFCRICEGNQEYERENKMNKLHKSLGGFCEGYSYESPAHYGCYSCRETYATIEQGINDVLLELEKRNIEADLYQSGGFCMLATVEIDKARTLWISSDVVGLDTVDADWVDMSDYATYRNDFSEKDLLQWVADSTEKALKELKVNV